MIWFVSLTWTYGTFWTTCSLETCRNELKLIVYTGRFLLRTLYLCSWHVNSRSLVIYLFKQLAHFLSTCIFLDQLLVAPLTHFFFSAGTTTSCKAAQTAVAGCAWWGSDMNKKTSIALGPSESWRCASISGKCDVFFPTEAGCSPSIVNDEYLKIVFKHSIQT